MILVKEWFILQILVASLLIPFWKQTVTLSFIWVMGNVPMNYNLCLDFFLRSTKICHQTCIDGYSGAYFRVCYHEKLAIACVVEWFPSWKQA